MEGGRSSVSLLWDPVGLRRPSKALELMGRVELSVWLPSVQTSFRLRPTDSADGEGERPCLREQQALGDFSCLLEASPLELEGFLVEVESGCFRVDMLELRPEPRLGLPLPPERLVLGNSTGGLGVTALGGDCFVTLGCLACQ